MLRVPVPPSCSPSEASGQGNQGWYGGSAKASEFDPDLLTGLAESSRERPLIWSERGL